MLERAKAMPVRVEGTKMLVCTSFDEIEDGNKGIIERGRRARVKGEFLQRKRVLLMRSDAPALLTKTFKLPSSLSRTSLAL